jgi:hypothetical protein
MNPQATDKHAHKLAFEAPEQTNGAIIGLLALGKCVLESEAQNPLFPRLTHMTFSHQPSVTGWCPVYADGTRGAYVSQTIVL